jgi:uncharacterized protein
MKSILNLRFFGVLFSVFSVVVFSTSSAFAQSKKPRKAPVKISVSQTQTSGLLYKISGKSIAKPSYLFGTIHIICPTDMFPIDKLSTYFNETQRLTLELDMDDSTVMAKMTTALNMPEGKTLKDYLSPEKYSKVDEMFKNTLGVPVDVLK